jgi:hypothetical protein
MAHSNHPNKGHPGKRGVSDEVVEDKPKAAPKKKAAKKTQSNG